MTARLARGWGTITPITGALEPLLDARGAASYLHLSVSWVYKAAERGELPRIRIGSALRFEPEALRAWVKTKAR